jgi:hypothetical protein
VAQWGSRLLPLAVAAAIAAAAFEPMYLRIFGMNRARFGAALVEMPYRKLPGLRRFLLEVRSRTRAGDVIAVEAPGLTWEKGYEYYYGRALYPLAGRRVVPLLDPQDHEHREELANASHVAVYGQDAPIPGFEVIWRGEHGALLRRTP